MAVVLGIGLDAWIRSYNTERTPPGTLVLRQDAMRTFDDTLPLAKDKLLQAA